MRRLHGQCAILALLGSLAGASAGDYYWSGSGDWLSATNWGGTAPSLSSDTGHIASGMATSTTNVFPGTLRLEGTDGAGGTLQLAGTGHGTYALELAGGTIRGANLNRSLASTNATVSAAAGTTTVLTGASGSAYLILGKPLSGTGDLRVRDFSGTAYFGLNEDNSSYGGEIVVTNARVKGGIALVLGAGGSIRLDSGGVLYQENSSAPGWIIPGGLVLNGGTLLDNGNNRVNLETNTPVVVSRASFIVLSMDDVKMTQLKGVLSGSADLSVSTTNYGGGIVSTCSLDNAANTYSGTIALTSGSKLRLNATGALPTNKPYASVVLHADGTNCAKLIIAANTTNTVNTLLTGGNYVARGTYDANSVGVITNYVAFGNSNAELKVSRSQTRDMGAVLTVR